MTDIIDYLNNYPDERNLILSRAKVDEIIAEIEKLRRENAAMKETLDWNARTSDLDFMGNGK